MSSRSARAILLDAQRARARALQGAKIVQPDIPIYTRTEPPKQMRTLRILNWLVGLVTLVITPINYDLAAELDFRERNQLYQRALSKAQKQPDEQADVDRAPVLSAVEELVVDETSLLLEKPTREQSRVNILKQPATLFGLAIFPVSTILVYGLRRYTAARTITKLWLRPGANTNLPTRLGVNSFTLNGLVRDRFYSLDKVGMEADVAMRVQNDSKAVSLKLPGLSGYCQVDLEHGVLHSAQLLDRLRRGDPSLGLSLGRQASPTRPTPLSRASSSDVTDSASTGSTDAHAHNQDHGLSGSPTSRSGSEAERTKTKK
eukprot:CAMPEP_0174238418 /NCGR_PEP_ID=MMETSP0417-20130205/11184_1 /TAXON_ID=242541 /ORGANISM="Mayorella sp, Strain BSH-02190019" /LENGTH=316 /DNA_ID=CAMNT_0015317249 /DNA_START=100 /DNA_END=1047 /DNA_ORIENTATION=+